NWNNIDSGLPSQFWTGRPARRSQEKLENFEWTAIRSAGRSRVGNRSFETTKEVGMKKVLQPIGLLLWVALFSAFFLPATQAQNAVMGELQFEGRSKVEKTSGVWVDGQYVGYLKELKGSKKVMLLPGDHVISVRQDGYQDFTQRVVIQPGQK